MITSTQADTCFVFTRLPLKMMLVCVVVMLSLTCRVNAAVFVSGQVVSGPGAAPVAGAIISLSDLSAAHGATSPIPGVAGTVPAAPLPMRKVQLGVVLAQTGTGAPEPAMTTTLGNGSFLLKVPHPGHYSLTVDAPQFILLERPLDVPAAGVSGLRLELTRPPSLRIKVLAPGGAPVTTGDVEVRLLTANRQPVGRAAGTWFTKPATPDGLLEVSTARTVALADAGAVGIAVRVKGIGSGTAFRTAWPTEPVTVQLAPGKVIAGKVVNAAGKPASGVEVRMDGADRDLAHRFLQGRDHTKSGEDGSFQFTDLLPGRYDLRFSLPPDNRNHFKLLTLTEARTEVTLTPQEQSGVAFDLNNGVDGPTGANNVDLITPIMETPAPGIPVSGKAVSNGKPVPGVVIALYALHGDSWYNSPPVDFAMSGVDGAFSFEAPVPGRYQMSTGWSQEADYNPSNRPVTVPAAGIKDADLPIDVRSKMLLRLVGVDGKPVMSGTVHVAMQVQSSNQGWEFNPSNDIGADGLVTVRSYQNISPATVTGVTITVRHDTAGWAHLHLDHWTDQPVTLQLQKGVTVKGQIVDAGGSPVKDASLQLYWLNQNDQSIAFENIGDTGVAADSHFELTQLPVGVYRLTATAPGASDQSTVVHIAPTANPFLTIRMIKGQTLTIHVVDLAGQPAVNGNIQVYHLMLQMGTYPQFEQMNQTPPNGGERTLTGLLPGTYFATAQLQNGGTATRLVTIVPGKDVSIVLRPAPQKIVTVSVVDAAGKPLGGATVKAFSISEQGWANVQEVGNGTSDKDGKYDLTIQRPGPYVVQVTDAGGKPQSHLIHVDATTTAVTIGPDDGQ